MMSFGKTSSKTRGLNVVMCDCKHIEMNGCLRHRNHMNRAGDRNRREAIKERNNRKLDDWLD